MTIYIVMHSHRHGVDLLPHYTLQGAEKSAGQLAADTAAEPRYSKLDTGEGFPWDQIEEWTDGEENIEIDTYEVLP